jgi:hypothetical protein
MFGGFAGFKTTREPLFRYSYIDFIVVTSVDAVHDTIRDSARWLEAMAMYGLIQLPRNEEIPLTAEVITSGHAVVSFQDSSRRP